MKKLLFKTGFLLILKILWFHLFFNDMIKTEIRILIAMLSDFFLGIDGHDTAVEPCDQEVVGSYPSRSLASLSCLFLYLSVLYL